MDYYDLYCFLLALICMFIIMPVYFKIAEKFNIIDKPNQRSSHDYITIRGGGVVFWWAAILYAIAVHPSNFLLPFTIGITMISVVSFWDDISSLSNKVRIIVHFLSISLIFYGLGMFGNFPWWIVSIAYIFFVGVLNAYNFMDGINGITGLYSLVILVSILYTNEFILTADITKIDTDFIVYPALACIVFLFYNFRKKARCFAGDIGSMAISFWIVTLLLMLMLSTKSLMWILFLAVYGVDSICTILHRLYLKQNIFEAHRLHFYQILSNECKISHLKVSVLYAVVQILICLFVTFNFKYKMMNETLLFFIVLLPLVACYLLKFPLMKKTIKI